MKKLFNIIRFLMFMGIGVAIIGAAAIYQVIYKQEMPIAEAGDTLVVKPGTTVRQIGNELAERGLIAYGEPFELAARLEEKAGSIKAGEYQLTRGMTPIQLLEKMVKGDVVLHSLTAPEGITFKELRALIAAEPKLEQTLEGLDDETVMARLDMAGQHPEGRFLPETYHFPRGTTDLEFLKRANRMLKRTLDAAWEARAEGIPLKSPYEALILASIIEKETAVPEERRQISGVFTRRLQKGMRLQTDPTVIYGMGERYDGNIRRRDLREATPYNTYVIKGLPPTPIALVGVKAIEAAVNPAPGDSLYFVSKNDGSHVFSATLAEHERYVDQYQRSLRRRPNNSGSASAEQSPASDTTEGQTE